MSALPTHLSNLTNWCGVYSSLISAHHANTSQILNVTNHKTLPGHLTGNCSDNSQSLPAEAEIVKWSVAFYTWSVPVVLGVGMVGNTVTLRVFLSPNMKKLAASTYLAALSTCDILALVFYVLTEWLRWGLPQLSHTRQPPAFLSAPGVCHVLLYLSYVTRFLSAWVIVTFTAERYIGVCHPLRRKDICGRRSALKVLSGLVTVAILLMLFKPILTSSRQFPTAGSSQMERCLPDPSRRLVTFCLDSVYALSITLIPFVIISLLNALIIRRLLRRHRRHRQTQVMTEESIIRMEFTVVLLVVSFVFIVLNLPYCVVWCQRYLLSSRDLHQVLSDQDYTGDRFDRHEGALMITRVIFYINYCVNFFLYSITGAYFRKELKVLVWKSRGRAKDRERRDDTNNSVSVRHLGVLSCSRGKGDGEDGAENLNPSSGTTSPQSWV